MPRSVLGPLMAFILLGAACNPIQPFTPTPTPKITIVENSGLICFYDYFAAERVLGGIFQVSGCYSTSCTARDETRLETRLIPEESAIRFHGRFVLRDLTQHGYGADACTLDCKGGGTLPFTITGVVSGTVYSVWLGDRRLGDFKASPEAPPRRSAPICYG